MNIEMNIEMKNLQRNTGGNGENEKQDGDKNVERLVLVSAATGLICIVITILLDNMKNTKNTSVNSIFSIKYSWKVKAISTSAIA